MPYHALLESPGPLQKIIDIIPSPVFIKDETHKWVLLNDAAARLLGGTREGLSGKSEYDIFPPDEATIAWASDDEVLATGRTLEREEQYTFSHAGETRTFVMRKSLLQVPPSLRYVVSVAADVTEYRNILTKNHFLSRHDALTSLPNRILFTETLEEAVRQDEPGGLTMLLVDLDGFKAVNDAYGHEAGDELLRVIAARLKNAVRATDLIARLGGDEFGILLRGGASPQQAAERVAHDICAAIAAPVPLSQAQTRVSASIGIAFFTPGQDLKELLRQADLAMYSVKRTGRHGYRAYDPTLETTASRQLHSDLLQALARRELHVAYQPLWHPQDGRLTGYEALLRWQHAHFGEIPPRVFIPIAEQSGLITIFGAYVLQAACAAALRWPEEVRLCVNVSPVQLADAQYARSVLDILHEKGFPTHRLELEITESKPILDQDTALDQLRLLKQSGVRLAADNFGTGAASLDMIHRLDLDRMKIPRHFVMDLPQDQRGLAIVRSLIRLAHDIGVQVTAEGVEHMEQALCLIELGCDEMQGYLFGSPDAPRSIL